MSAESWIRPGAESAATGRQPTEKLFEPYTSKFRAPQGPTAKRPRFRQEKNVYEFDARGNTRERAFRAASRRA
jgi:hypothetical protein